MAEQPAPPAVDLPSGCGVFKVRECRDARGRLFAIENADLHFEIARVYMTSEVPAGQERGGHAHRHVIEVLIAAAGEFEVVLDDGTRRSSVLLDSPSNGLLVAPRVWRVLRDFSPGAVCLVLASAGYDEGEYINDYGELAFPGRQPGAGA
jgi:hypothetical protein